MRFLKAYRDLMDYGKTLSPRGQQIKELENYAMTLHPIQDRFTSFKARKFNLEYAKYEFAWYLRGNRFETAITEEAQMWKNIIDVDGGINSNYGQYIFQNQLQYSWVIDELVRDKDSRRAVMTLLNHTHLREDNPDIVCTYSIGFRIRNNKLNMSIHMRSWDAVWGMSNDVFCFSCIYEFIYTVLKLFYKDLKIGEYHHIADSFHVYERHYDMIDRILTEGTKGYYDIYCPRISSSHECVYLRNHEELEIRDSYKFSKWLLNK